jgi:hypothetical protein
VTVDHLPVPAALALVPVAPGVAVADVRTGIVVFGAAEALAIVAVFLHGWSPNSPFPLLSGYRFVGVALSSELLSMFVLIAAAIPAESLSIGAIVDSQAGLWNVVRQPLVQARTMTSAGPCRHALGHGQASRATRRRASMRVCCNVRRSPELRPAWHSGTTALFDVSARS